MSNDNQILKDIQIQIDHQKKLWTEEQEKAKVFFEQLKDDSVANFEHAKETIQKHMVEVNNFTKNIQSHVQNQSFDFNSFTNAVSEYQKRQLEILSESAKEHTKKVADFQNKLVSFYHDKQENLKKHLSPDNTVTKKNNKDSK